MLELCGSRGVGLLHRAAACGRRHEWRRRGRSAMRRKGTAIVLLHRCARSIEWQGGWLTKGRSHGVEQTPPVAVKILRGMTDRGIRYLGRSVGRGSGGVGFARGQKSRRGCAACFRHVIEGHTLASARLVFPGLPQEVRVLLVSHTECLAEPWAACHRLNMSPGGPSGWP